MAVALAAAVGWAAGSAYSRDDPTPHAEALALVLRARGSDVRAAESPGPVGRPGAAGWWHDTKERTWVVRRPFAPGVIDSTHLFDVSYRIDGKEAAAWMVDTRERTISPPPKK
jgi:hypothetical protein